MKKFLLSALCAVAVSTLFAQTAYFECDFSGGIPQTFTLCDEDGLEPSIDMKNVGFGIGTPWLTLDEADGNRAAVSTSWYRKAGTSDDWMITAPVTIESGAAILSWRAKAGDAEYRDGYSVYVSETASTPNDFKALSPVFTTKQEKAEWTEQNVSLADFEGKTVRIAFVNNTRDRSTLWIDDLFVGVPAAMRIYSTIPRVLYTDTNIPISGTVTNVSAADIKGYTISFRFGDGETFEYKSSKTIPAGQTASFNFNSKTQIERNQTLPYTLTVHTGKDTSTATGVTTCLFRRIVAEEVTGTWCGYCVRGIVAMNRMKQLYPETFLGIAVHAGIETWEDPMDFSDYTEYLFESMNMSGYPHATVNRRKMQTGDPANIPNYYEQIMERELTAGLRLHVDAVDKDTYKTDIHTDVYFLNDMDESQHTLAYVLIENNIHKDAEIDKDGQPIVMNGYEQSNNFSGADVDMDGFESLPPVVPGTMMTFHDVARAFWGDNFEGIEGSLPSVVKADTPYTHKYTVTLPDNVLNYDNTELAALLINKKTGEIINADVVPLRPFVSGLHRITESDSEIRVAHNGNELTLSCTETIEAAYLYSIDGILVCEATPRAAEFSMNTNGLHGIYILKAATAGSSIIKNITL